MENNVLAEAQNGFRQNESIEIASQISTESV
jgi:hypothetical protein